MRRERIIPPLLSPAEFYKSLPKKRMAAAVLLQNEQGEILIVKPTYRPEWLLPGGTIEADESPRQACEREVREEIGLNLPIGTLLSVDYIPQEHEKTESIQFIFDGGLLSQEQIQTIQLQEEELSEYRFSPVEEAIALLAINVARRIRPSLQALQANGAVYLERGQI
jgi:8-oxo-dGTP diphosphatase